MRLIGYIIVAALALSVLQHAIAALLIVGGLMLLWGILFRPRQVFGFAAFCLLSGIVQHHFVVVLIGGVLFLLIRLLAVFGDPGTDGSN